MIDTLYLVYPTMIGLMSELHGVEAGRYPFFEDALNRDQCNPEWGAKADDSTFESWVKSLKGNYGKVCMSVTFSGEGTRPSWCGTLHWFDCVKTLMNHAKRIIIVGQAEKNFLYDQIELGRDPGILKQLWKDSENTHLSVVRPECARVSIDSLHQRKGLDLIYRKTGLRLNMLQRKPRKNTAVWDRVKEAQAIVKKSAIEELFEPTTFPRGMGQSVRPVVNHSDPIPDEMIELFATRFAICISAHPGYAKYLPKLCEEWDQQIGDLPVRKYLLLDGGTYDLPDGWDTIWPDDGVSSYGEPSQLRNKALELDVDWIQYWDADNMPEKDHFEITFKHAYWADEVVGLIYPEHVFESGYRIPFPRNGDPRLGTFVDTAACWRREAMLGCGGWQSGMNEEDWALSRDIWVAGWKFEPSGVKFRWRDTPGNRTSQLVGGEVVWGSKDFGIVILLRGDFDYLNCIEKDMNNLDLPRHCGITVVCDGDDMFRHKVSNWMDREGRFERKTIIQARPLPRPIKSEEDFMLIHSRVADLYARAFRCTPEEMILTWEDDVRPSQTALRELSDQFARHPNLAAVGAPYVTRGSLDLAASKGKYWWDSPVRADEVGEEPYEVGMIAGGFTLWHKSALEENPMLGSMNDMTKQGFLGWDGFLCKRMNQNGWHLQLCGKSKVLHLPK